MISSNDFRNGVTVEMDGDAWQVIDFQHVKPGKGAAFVRAKMRNIRTGAVVERTFNAGEKLARAHLDNRQMQFLYEADDAYNFMDNETFEQTSLTAQQLGSAKNFLKENMSIGVQFYQGAVMGVELPVSVELTVVETDPGIRGDTATGGTKPAKLETGIEIKVPLFIKEGEKVKVATETREFAGRA